MHASKLVFTSCEKNDIGDKKAYRKTYLKGNVSILLKTGLCVAACAVLLLSAQNGDTLNMESEGNGIEELGKLKFVELPGLISVFAPTSSLQAPLANSEVEYASDYAIFTAKGDQQIFSMLSGNVRYVSYDSEQGGQCVSIMSQGSDVEMIISGMQYCTVEEGQKVERGDSIGVALKVEEVVVKLLKSGRPVDISTEFQVEP